MAEAERWDRVYAHEPHLYSTAPNALLMEVASRMAPGDALDIGMGQGRNASWLAGQGWQVTGLDVSAEGLRQAAAAAHPNLTIMHTPVEDFALGEAQWDLIAGMYVHGVMLRESARIVSALRPSGRLVIEGFHRDVMKIGIEGLTGGLLGYTTNALLRKFHDLRIELYQDTTALADWRRIQAPIVRLVARKS